jgi:hypothetical protein
MISWYMTILIVAFIAPSPISSSIIDLDLVYKLYKSIFTASVHVGVVLVGALNIVIDKPLMAM